jgi:hypothetical protein
LSASGQGTPRFLQDAALGLLGVERFLFARYLFGECFRCNRQALHLALGELAAVFNCLLFPVEFAAAGDEAEALGFLIFQCILRIPGIDLQ